MHLLYCLEEIVDRLHLFNFCFGIGSEGKPFWGGVRK
jgi:hypothetical protein